METNENNLQPVLSRTNGIKPGYKTTEFWLTAVAMIVSLLFASDIIPTGSSIERLLGTVAAALGGAGYAVSRGLAKKTSYVFCIVVSTGFFVGCTTFESGAYKSLAALSTSVNQAMSAFGEATDNGMVKAEDVAKVRTLYTNYQNAMKAAKAAEKTYRTTKDKPAMDQAMAQVESIGAEIIRTIRELTDKKKSAFNRSQTFTFIKPVSKSGRLVYSV